jgi:hypothetical protein
VCSGRHGNVVFAPGSASARLSLLASTPASVPGLHVQKIDPATTLAEDAVVPGTRLTMQF